MKMKVLVADDNPAFLRQLVSLLESEFEVVAAVENSQVVLEHVRSHRPDVAVLDLEMVPYDGIEITRQLRTLGATPAVVICSVENDPEIVEAAQQAGALGYVFKKRMTRDLITAVKSAARGESFKSST